MSTGELRERVRFERRKEGSDGKGNVQGNWLSVITTWARIQPLRGGEQFDARRLAGTNVVLIRVRYNSTTVGVGADCRAINIRNDAVYAIRSVENRDERKRYLDMIAESGVPSG